MNKIKLKTYQKLRLIRESKDITQEQFGEVIGMSAGAYSKYETGHSSITIDLLERFAKGLNVNCWELLPDSISLIKYVQELETINQHLKNELQTLKKCSTL